MGRRWIVQVDAVKAGTWDGNTYMKPRYLGTAGVRDDLVPVSVSYASKFLTKRAALEAANGAGFEQAEAMKTWW